MEQDLIKNQPASQSGNSKTFAEPVAVKEMFWLAEPFEFIAKSIVSKRLAHGLLVTAPVGSGKKLLVDELAKSLLCDSNKTVFSEETNSHFHYSCDDCKSCNLFNEATHPDLHSIEFLVDSKGKAKKTIGIEQIRVLTEKLRAKPLFNGWRIAVIHSVEKMTTAAFNALLKTLEEPGENTLIFLLAESLYQVPATVKSRCQQIKLDLPETKLINWLCSQHGYSQADAAVALNACNNAPLSALSFLQSNQGSFYQQVHSSLNDMLKAKVTPQGFISNYHSLGIELWQVMANYFFTVQLDKLNGETSYSLVPNTLIQTCYRQLIDYHRIDQQGGNLQETLQLEAILVPWFELGRKIVHYSK